MYKKAESIVNEVGKDVHLSLKISHSQNQSNAGGDCDVTKEMRQFRQRQELKLTIIMIIIEFKPLFLQSHSTLQHFEGYFKSHFTEPIAL